MEIFEIEEKLKNIMTQEISLFSQYKEEFNTMKNLVMEKEWINLQRSFESVQAISNRIKDSDSKRDQLYSELCRLAKANGEDSFYTVMSRIHKNGGGELNDIYRMVKHEANSMKILNDGFNRFLQSRKTLVKEIMEELVPDRKGTIYNKQGFSSHKGSSSSLILNKHL